MDAMYHLPEGLDEPGGQTNANQGIYRDSRDRGLDQSLSAAPVHESPFPDGQVVHDHIQ
jgi:hypothetical protein